MELLGLLATLVVSFPVVLGFLGIFGGIALGIATSAVLLIYKAMSFFEENNDAEVVCSQAVNETRASSRVSNWYREPDWQWDKSHPTAI